MQTYTYPNIPDNDQKNVSSALLTENSYPKIEYLSQKYPNHREKLSNTVITRPLKNNRRNSDNNRPQKNEKSRSLCRTKEKENIKPVSKSKIIVKPTKETKKIENQETKKELQDYLFELEKKIEKQHNKIKTIKTSLEERKNNFHEYSKHLKETKKIEKLLETYENEKTRLEKNEVNFIKNLSDQQKLTREALNKLYFYQEEGLKEKEQLREYYENHLKEQLAKIEKKYKNKIKNLKNNKEELLLLNQSQANKEEIIVANYQSDISSLKNQLNMQIKENEQVIKENVAFKVEIKERREKLEMELNQLKSKMLMDNDIFIRENDEKTYLKQKIQTLTRDLDLKEQQRRENEQFYKLEIDKLEEKISILQERFHDSQEYKTKIEEMNDILKKKDSECSMYKSMSQERCFQKNTQKQQWGKIYSELLDEIKGLKKEIDQLGTENKKLLSSVSHNRFGSESQTILSSNRL